MPFAICILATYADIQTWFCSGESASEGTSEGSDANSQNVSAELLVYLLIWSKYVCSYNLKEYMIGKNNEKNIEP